ncbi:hypothetical protein [Nocardioides gilvus]|uniref:hypothetical protein n=1 Tax=Nocardioides gilvus TaxID=1735589 RepID=UPI000D749E6F|nr:hypothetical protein [Nocardioides gilvus]
MPTPEEHPSAASDHPSRTRWLVAGTTALVVGALVVGGFWVTRDGPSDPNEAQASAQERGRAVLTDASWVLSDFEDDPEYGGELEYNSEDGELAVHWRLAEDYDDYVADRQDIGPAATLDVLGKESLMWAYDDEDHTVIRPVEGGFTLEIRVMGLPRAAFVDLLSQLRLVSRAEFEAQLPEHAVLPSERPEAIAEILSDVPAPVGFDASSVTTSELMRLRVIDDVTVAVTCAWVEEYAGAVAAGDEARVTKAREAAGTAHSWSALEETEDDGGANLVWEYTDQIADGVSGQELQRMVEEAPDALGCA